jgi:4-hydroxy-tetrahydrodipicolinate synthase
MSSELTTPGMTGVYTALVTPFRDDESLDGDALRRLVDDQFAAGIAGVVVNGSTGEFAAMSAEERREVVEVAVDAARGRGPVIVGLGSVRTADSVAYAEHALAAGAEYGMLVMPYYEPISADELFDFVAAVAAVGLKLIIYNNPMGTGESLDPEFLARLAEIDNVEAVKDTTPDTGRLVALDRLTGGSIQAMSGWDTSHVFSLLAGAQAVIWGAPNAHPESCVALWRVAVEERDLEGTLALWREIEPLNAFLMAHSYMAANKAGANLRGVQVGKPRLPIHELSAAKTEELAGLLHRADQAVAVVTEASGV